MRSSLLRSGLGLGLGCLLAACPTPNQGTETSDAESGDCTAGTLNCVCAPDGCDLGLVCASGLCVAGGDTTATGGTTGGPVTTASTGGDATSTSGTTGDSATTSTPECQGGPGASTDCPPERPFCDGAGACVDCSGLASCAAVDPAHPVCDAMSGACVQCSADDASACGGNTPICDVDQQTCTKCSAHEQCTSGACDLGTGACFPDDAVLWVDRAANPCGTGTQDSPFCEIQDAVETIAANTPTVVKVKPGAMTYKTKIDVASGAVVAILGDGGMPVVDVLADAALINDNARVYFSRLQLGSSLTTAKGFLCVGGDVWTDRVDITARKSVAIDAIDCNIRLRRSRVYLNPGGGLKLSGGSTRIENSFVTSNGTGFSSFAGVYLTNNAELTAVYTTIIDNDAAMNADSLHCVNPGLVTIRNSVMFGQSAMSSVNCTGAEATESVIDAMAIAGSGTQVVPTVQATWFKDPANGDFHIKALAPFKDIAVWHTGDPAVDYDGELRPSIDATPDYAGADRLP